MQHNNKILSIRLSPDGLSFWTTGLTGSISGNMDAHRDLWEVSSERWLSFDTEKDIRDNIEACAAAIKEATARDTIVSVEAYQDGLKSVLVPAEYSTGNAAYFKGLLEENGIEVGEDDGVACVNVVGDINAVMVYDKKTVNILKEFFGDIAIVSPYSINIEVMRKCGAGRRRSVAVYLSRQYAYITVFERKSGDVLYADAMQWSADTDILYYLSSLDQTFEFKKGKVYLRGAGADKVSKLLGKYFRKTRCE